jgi:adenosylhomocysteine nucleosidase
MPDGPQQPIAVICALADELVHLREALPPGREEWRGNRSVWHTELDGHPIVLALCGIGMMMAAAVAEAVIGQYAPAAVLNFGCTGAHRADLLPGDMVIGERVVAYQNTIEGQDGVERYVGMKYLRQNVQEKAVFLKADPGLLERAVRVAATLEGQHEPWPTGAGWPAAVAHRHPNLVVGTVASADRWNRTPASIEAIVRLHDTHCEDMEAAAIALTCASHDVPFLTVKDISNNELVETSIEGPEWLELTAGQLGRRAGAVVLGILRDLAASSPPLPRQGEGVGG